MFTVIVKAEYRGQSHRVQESGAQTKEGKVFKIYKNSLKIQIEQGLKDGSSVQAEATMYLPDGLIETPAPLAKRGQLVELECTKLENSYQGTRLTVISCRPVEK